MIRTFIAHHRQAIDGFAAYQGIRELSLNEIDLGGIPISHVRYLAQQGVRLNALRLKTYTPSRKYAIAVVTLTELESDLIDVVIQMNDEILAGIYQRAQTRADKYYRKHRRMVTRVIHAFRLMSNIYLDEALSPIEKIARIDASLPPEKLRAINVALLENLREDILRPQTIQPAIASLVEFYSRLPLAQIWGEGGTSSSDGQGFAAAGHPLGAVYHRQRFRRRRRGFIVYTHILDNYAPFYTQVIPASAREAIYVLDGLLYHALSLMPREHYTDSHGYTDIVFALTYLLGFRLAIRMARFPDLTLWYGKGFDVEFQELFHGRINLKSIASQWEAIQRICATIQNGRTRASQIIRKVSAFNRKHSLFKGLRNFGRLVRTRHILEIAGDKEYRKRILQGNNKSESRNALAKDLRYARQGVIREKDPDMRLCVVSAINLMILSLAIWNTIYIQRAIRSLREEGYQINQEDLEFLSPFIHAHINLYGQFFFQPFSGIDPSAARKEFEPLF